MRNMSYMLTTDQIREETKTETRRLAWKFARVGMMVMPVYKGMGLKAGEKVQYLRNAPIRFTALRWEPLNAITPDAVKREGFPGKSPEWFVDMFVRHNRLKDPATPVHVMTFEYLYTCRICGNFEPRSNICTPSSLAAPGWICKACQNDYDSAFEEFDREPEQCETCGGSGVMISCLDDLCVGAGRCMHGDGEQTCPDCEGEGVTR